MTDKPHLAVQIEEALRDVSPTAFDLIDACLAAVVARRAAARLNEFRTTIEGELIAARLNEFRTTIEGELIALYTGKGDSLNQRIKRSDEADQLIKRRDDACRSYELAKDLARAAEDLANEEADELAKEIGL